MALGDIEHPHDHRSVRAIAVLTHSQDGLACRREGRDGLHGLARAEAAHAHYSGKLVGVEKQNDCIGSSMLHPPALRCEQHEPTLFIAVRNLLLPCIDHGRAAEETLAVHHIRGQCAPIVIGHVCEAGGQEVARRMPAALEGIAEPEPAQAQFSS